ncbi:MAG: carboxylesterase family protein, partial [Lachnospiraceae bacterium]|nr:carboxylesterase family protein [Lachnospiraceae bacterium]
MAEQIKTAYGLVEGVDCGNYTVFRGIPYAKPPVGERRWKAPERPDPWDGVLKADTFSAKVLQSEVTPQNPYHKEFYEDPEYLRPSDEDSLYLNIWTPKGAAADAKLPVAFWIHGGGFGGGYSSEIEFDGEAFAAQGVILVTINYRCGVCGFLAHPWLDAENEKGVSGNYGILDQIAALTWVYENIDAFGGDPANITVFGQSAGCMSTQVLVSSELTEGMIAKAILQSGCACEVPALDTQSLESMEKWGEKF